MIKGTDHEWVHLLELFDLVQRDYLNLQKRRAEGN